MKKNFSEKNIYVWAPLLHERGLHLLPRQLMKYLKSYDRNSIYVYFILDNGSSAC
jgi:hypothetical protein